MYLVKIINTNGMTERGKNIKTKSDIRSCINQTRNTPIGGIKDKDCSIKNNLFNMDNSFFYIGKSILLHSLLEKNYWCSSQIVLYIISKLPFGRGYFHSSGGVNSCIISPSPIDLLYDSIFKVLYRKFEQSN